RRSRRRFFSLQQASPNSFTALLVVLVDELDYNGIAKGHIGEPEEGLMSVLRRILGILVMLAGIVGLVLAVAGLAGVWTVKPSVVGYATSTIDTLQGSITTSQEVMVVTEEALGATVSSLEALSVMLSSTAASVDDTA